VHQILVLIGVVLHHYIDGAGVVDLHFCPGLKIEAEGSTFAGGDGVDYAAGGMSNTSAFSPQLLPPLFIMALKGWRGIVSAGYILSIPSSAKSWEPVGR
jgi:hypothetical protein